MSFQQFNGSLSLTVPYDFFNVNSTGMTQTTALTSHVSGRTTFLAWGTNVIQRITSVATTQPNSGQIDAAYVGHVNAMETSIIFTMLPDTKKYNARSNPNISTTGTGWFDFPGVGNNYATNSTTLNATITAINLNGRYIGVSFLLNAIPDLYSRLKITIDGVDYTNNIQLLTTMNSTFSTNGTNYQPQDFVIDTGESTNHTMTITNLGDTTNKLYVFYFYFFDQNDPSVNPVFVMEQPMANYSGVDYVNATSNQGSLTRAMMWWNAVKRLVYRFRVYYGLPIYYIDNTYNNMLATGSGDQIHPSKQWHAQMAQYAYDFLTRGELAYDLL